MILTGGFDEAKKDAIFSKAYALEIYKGEWKARNALPSLNRRRYSHSSCVLGDVVYVFCGFIHYYVDMTSSIEMLGMSLNNDLSFAYLSKSW